MSAGQLFDLSPLAGAAGQYLGTCSKCSTTYRRALADRRVRCCDRWVSMAPIVGRHSDRSYCDGRCMFARGPQCDCSCSGTNHGRGWAS